jgi:hypothetical protein
MKNEPFMINQIVLVIICLNIDQRFIIIKKVLERYIVKLKSRNFLIRLPSVIFCERVQIEKSLSSFYWDFIVIKIRVIFRSVIDLILCIEVLI